MTIGTPFVKVQVEYVVFSCCGWGHERETNVLLATQLLSYHSHLSVWEPICESFESRLVYIETIQERSTAIAKSRQTSADCPNVSSHLRVETRGTAVLNIAPRTMSSLTKMQTMIALVWEPSLQPATKQKPYFFQNFTEFDIYLSFATKNVKVQAGSKTSFSIHLDEQSRHRLTLFFDDDLGWPSIEVSLTEMKSFHKELSWCPPQQSAILSPAFMDLEERKNRSFCYTCSSSVKYRRTYTCRSCKRAFCKHCCSCHVAKQRYCMVCFDKYHLVMQSRVVNVNAVIQLECRNGIKVITLHSELGLKNETQTPMEIRIPSIPDISKGHSDNPPRVAIIPIGETHWVPLLAASLYQSKYASSRLYARLRPVTRNKTKTSDPENYEWSKEVALCHPCPIQKEISYVCPSSVFSQNPADGRGSFPGFIFNLCRNQDYTAEDEIDLPQQQYSSGALLDRHEYDEASYPRFVSRPLCSVLRICNPVLIQNVLSTNIDVKLQQRIGKHKICIVDSVTIHRGKTYSVPVATRERSVYLAVSIPALGCDWSRPCKLRRNIETLDSVGPIQVSDAHGRHLDIRASVSVSAGTVRIALFCDYWVFDMTNLNLIFSKDAKSVSPQLMRATESDGVCRNHEISSERR